MYPYRSFVILCVHLSSPLIIGNFILFVRLSYNRSLVSWNWVFLVRHEGNKQNQMKKSIHNQTSFCQISLEIVSMSNVLTILSAFQNIIIFLNRQGCCLYFYISPSAMRKSDIRSSLIRTHVSFLKDSF